MTGVEQPSQSVLVTGAAGYIGSHTCVALLEAGHKVIALDNLINSSQVSLDRVQQITGRTLTFVRADVRDRHALDALLAHHPVDACIHFAGLKAVGESMHHPLAYWDANVHGASVLMQALQASRCRTMLFSSSATVYGNPQSLPLEEDHPLSATNTYAETKLTVEVMLRSVQRADPRWRVAALRYFNPVGAHPSGLIGEHPQGVPNNLMPFVAQVAVGKREELQVFGGDWDTPDGTGVRDYVHVVDLAEGHLAALHAMAGGLAERDVVALNLGTGRGHSVLEMIRAFEHASGVSIPYRIVARRPGDIAGCWAATGRAERLLGWRATRTLADMCADAWRWQQHNPNGYDAA